MLNLDSMKSFNCPVEIDIIGPYKGLQLDCKATMSKAKIILNKVLQWNCIKSYD